MSSPKVCSSLWTIECHDPILLRYWCNHVHFANKHPPLLGIGENLKYLTKYIPVVLASSILVTLAMYMYFYCQCLGTMG